MPPVATHRSLESSNSNALAEVAGHAFCFAEQGKQEAPAEPWRRQGDCGSPLQVLPYCQPKLSACHELP